VLRYAKPSTRDLLLNKVEVIIAPSTGGSRLRPRLATKQSATERQEEFADGSSLPAPKYVPLSELVGRAAPSVRNGIRDQHVPATITCELLNHLILFHFIKR
jgi:hypothetical protein